MISLTKKSSTIGTAMNVIVNGSADGVAIAAKMKEPTMIHGRYAAELLALDDAGQVEQHDEDRDLERDPEDEQGPGEELQVLVEVDEVGEALRVQADQDLQALRQGDVAQEDAEEEQRARRSATKIRDHLRSLGCSPGRMNAQIW